MQIKPLAAMGVGLTAFVGLPMVFYALSDAPTRSALKEALSILTVLAFSMMIAQFYLARSNTALFRIFKAPKVQTVHKYIAYSAIGVILLHPYLIVLPRYFEGGVAPWTAFVEIVTNISNPGILAGIVAWIVVLMIGITAYFRRNVMQQMDKKYRGWRGLHAVLVLAFVLPATWHVIDLGRHLGWGLSLYFLALLTGGLVLLARLYPDALPKIWSPLSKVPMS